jgi:hypothetical protein
MRRHVLTWSLLLGLSLPATSFAGTNASINIQIGNAPPPPVIVYREEPRSILVPGTTVYVLEGDRHDYDCFRYGVYWYIWNDGFWYRSRNWRGPFTTIAVKYVPRAVINVPQKHWKRHPHGMPPGLAKKQRGDVVVVREKDGKGRGRR